MRDPHTPSKRGPATPEGKAKALMNLAQNQEAAQLQEIAEGKRKRLYSGRDIHGVYLIDINQPQTKAIAQQISAILEGDPTGYIKKADQITVNLLAVCLRRIQQIEAYLDKAGGMTNKKGSVRPIVEYLVKLLRESREYCTTLGLSPAARAKLGADSAAMLGYINPGQDEAIKEALKDPEVVKMAEEIFRKTHPPR